MIASVLQPDDSSCPCLNGGTCEYLSRRGRTIIYCHCPTGYFGTRCEICECKQFVHKIHIATCFIFICLFYKPASYVQ